MDTANIFVDEFGNTAIGNKKAGTFSHFIYCSVIINAKDKDKAERLRQKIAKDNNLGPDIKSNNLGNKLFNRRLKILQELTEGLDFTIDVLVIDKSKLENALGLSQKRVFYKYFQDLFVKKYSDRFESFAVWADKVGEAFQYELADYIQQKSITPTLFQPERMFIVSDDKTGEKLIQLADIICGSVGKIFCTSHLHEKSQEIYDILHTRMSVEFFPSLTTSDEPNPQHKHPHDREIKDIALEIVATQLKILKQRDSLEESRLLEHLLMNFRVDSSRLVPTYEITEVLSKFFKNITDEKVRTIVRNLRYDGIFIVSHPGKSGYKLANSYWDITQQFSHYLSYVIPMLKKVKIINTSIAEKTFNHLNILESDPALQELKQLLTAIK